MNGYVKVPNWVITDKNMYDSTRKVLFALIACTGSRGSFCKSHDELAAIAGLCRSTVSKALKDLEKRGLLITAYRYRYSPTIGRVVRKKSRYRLIGCDKCLNGYTLIPRRLLEDKMTPAEFTIALQVYRLSGRKGRCYPSLRRFAVICDHVKATICRAVKRLHSLQTVIRSHCKKRNHSASCNSYYPTCPVIAGKKIFSRNGGLKFTHTIANKKIAEGSYLYKKEKGVFEFSTLTNFLDFPEFYWDGTGVRVSAADEQISAG